MSKVLILLIKIYQKTIGAMKRPVCVFYPTCSQYAKEAIEKYGAFRGSLMTAKRILRCHPWQKNNIDPVP